MQNHCNFFYPPNTIAESESKGFSNKKVNPPLTANHSVSPKLVRINNSRIRIGFKGTFLKQGKVIFTPSNVVNLFSMN